MWDEGVRRTGRCGITGAEEWPAGLRPSLGAKSNTCGRTLTAAQVMKSNRALKIRPPPGAQTDSPDDEPVK